MKWLGQWIRDVGGRGFVYGIVTTLLASVLLWFGRLEGAEWVEYSKWVGLAFMGAKLGEVSMKAVGKWKNGAGANNG